MITDEQLLILKEKAEQAKLLLNAEAEYQAALEEKRKEETQAKAEAEVEKLQTDLDSKSSEFQVKLAEASDKLKSLLSELFNIEQEFNKLDHEADVLSKAAHALARAKARRGDYNQLAQAVKLTHFDNDFIEGQAAKLINQRFSIDNPLYFSVANLKLGDLGRWLLSSEYWRNIRLQLVGSQSTTVEAPKSNGHTAPLETDKKIVSQDEFLKLWNRPH